MLLNLQAKVDRLEDIARPYEMPSSAPAATCSMRIISDEEQLLFDALISADHSLHKLMHSPLAEVAEDNMGRFCALSRCCVSVKTRLVIYALSE
jgi:hypothetical protein